MLQDLVTDGPDGQQVRCLMPRDEPGPYNFQRERGLPRTAQAYCDYLIAADDFVRARNRRLATHAATITQLAEPVCQACLDTSNGVHQRWTLDHEGLADQRVTPASRLLAVENAATVRESGGQPFTTAR